MKARLFMAAAAIACSALAAFAGPQIKFATTSHDFGKIPAGGGRVTAVYTFTNTGDEPLLILSVTNGGCGCTTPSFTTSPVKPGQTGEIKVTFDPKGRAGGLNRKVLVETNVSKKRIGLKFEGTVIPE